MAENDFSERLNQLLSNPEALSMIMNAAMNFSQPNSAAGPTNPVNTAQMAFTQPVNTPPAGTPAASTQSQ
jgi:hypothetical protein